MDADRFAAIVKAMGTGASRRRVLRAATGIAALGGAAGLAPPRVAAAHSGTAPGTPASEAAVLDLAAMTPLPRDVPERAAVLGHGAMQTRSEAVTAASALGGDLGAIGRALEAAGWRRRYHNSLWFTDAVDPEDPERSLRTAESGVSEFADEDGAAAWFAFRTDAAHLAPGSSFAVEVVDDAAAVGDASWLVRLSPTDPGAPDPGEDGLWLTFRRGRLVADLRLSDATDVTLSLDDIEPLAAAFARRIDEVLAGAGPGLGALVLRLEPVDAAPFFLPFETYLRRDGETVPQRGEPREVFAARDAGYRAATDVYTLQHFLLPGAEERHATDPHYGARLYRFPDAAAAAEWLAGTPAFLRSHDIAAETIPGAARFGEASVALSVPFSRPGSDELIRSHVVVLHVGGVAAWVEISAPFAAPRAAVEELAAAQAACLEAGACPDRAPVPAALVASWQE